jgi:hypothetical protein
MRVLGPCAGVDRRTVLTAIVAAAPLLGVRAANGEVKVSQAVVHYEATSRDGQESAVRANSGPACGRVSIDA